MSPGVQKACTPGVDRAKPTPRATSSASVYGSYQVRRGAVATGPGRAATALMAITPTSCSSAWASSASASRR